MKLIVAGATGLVGSEVITQALQISDITQVIALARNPVEVDDNIDSSKLKNVVIRDYASIPIMSKRSLQALMRVYGTFRAVLYFSSTLS